LEVLFESIGVEALVDSNSEIRLKVRLQLSEMPLELIGQGRAKNAVNATRKTVQGFDALTW
jgi:hypothetical protein